MDNNDLTPDWNNSDSKLSRIEEFVAKVGLFARQYPEFKHNVYSSGLPHNHFVKEVTVCFTAPNGKEQVGFLTMIDSVYNPYGEEETDLGLYKALIDKLECELNKSQNEGCNGQGSH